MRMTPAAAPAATALTLALVLAGCSSPPAPEASGSSPATSSARPVPSVSSTPMPTGCAPTEETTPDDAVTRETLDVDGDGRPDTEWIADADGAVRFGVTTASGATFSFDIASASPVERSGFVSRLGEDRVIAMVTDGREAFVQVVADCGFVQPSNVDGDPYTFDLQNLRGNGTGLGCVDATLAGFKATRDGGGYTVRQTLIVLSDDGSEARNGESTVIGEDLPADDESVVRAQSVTCGDDSVESSGVSLTGWR